MILYQRNGNRVDSSRALSEESRDFLTTEVPDDLPDVPPYRAVPDEESR